MAADDRLKAAAELLQANRLQLAVYVNHIGIECLLKTRILRQANVDSVAVLRGRWNAGNVDELFAGRSGHNLKFLAEKAGLKRVLQVNQTAHLLQQPAWQRLCDVARPYSLRYGQELPTQQSTKDEIQWATSLRDTLWPTL